MKRYSCFIKFFLFFLIVISLEGFSQNLIKNGDFEYPVTDELSLKMENKDQLPGWTFDSPVSIINHTRLYPYSNFQCLLIPAISGHKTIIRQDFYINKNTGILLSFALAASRIESGIFKVCIDGRVIDSREYTDYWVPSETRLSDHMKWIEIAIPVLRDND